MIQSVGSEKNVTGQLLRGHKIRQYFAAEGTYLSKVGIYFVTFKRRNAGVVTVELKAASGETLASDSARMDEIKDNSFHMFDVVAQTQKGRTYQVVISASGTSSGRSVALRWGTSDSDREKFVDGMSVVERAGIAMRLRFGAKKVVKQAQARKVAPAARATGIESREDAVRGLISVVIPYYDTNAYLCDCLRSVAAQTYTFFEVVVVDDGSNEPLPPEERLAACCPNNPLAVIRHGENKGASAARNSGYERSSGEYLFFLDSDCVLKPGAFEHLMQSLVGSDFAFAYGNFKWGNAMIEGRGFDLERLKGKNYITTMSLVRQEAFPGFDESLRRHQDWDLWLTIAEKGGKGVWVDEMLFESPMRKGSISSGESISRAESMKAIRKKHRI